MMATRETGVIRGRKVDRKKTALEIKKVELRIDRIYDPKIKEFFRSVKDHGGQSTSGFKVSKSSVNSFVIMLSIVLLILTSLALWLHLA